MSEGQEMTEPIYESVRADLRIFPAVIAGRRWCLLRALRRVRWRRAVER